MIDQILTLADAGTPVASISAQLSIPPAKVYSILRTHRPDRPRTRRQRTSQTRLQILALAKVAAPKRVARLMKGKCSRQYVYRILSE